MKTVPFLMLSMLFACSVPGASHGRPATPGGQTANGTTFQTPFPPYPYQARATGAQGSGSIKVIFDEHGKAVKVIMIKSTGHRMLDQNTVQFVLANWKSSGGKQATIVRPITYRLVGVGR